MRVLKWPLRLDESEQKVGGGRIALIDTQSANSGQPVVWTLEAGYEPESYRTVRVYGTGQAIPDDWGHVGSVNAPPFVWHIFEKPVTSGD